jgi:hypothetical protein
VIDEHGRTEYLSVAAAHRSDCTFGPGFFRVTFGGHTRFLQNQNEVAALHSLVGGMVKELKVERDGLCLDGTPLTGDANTPDVVDAEWWLGLEREAAMTELGLTREEDYRRVYEQIEAAVYRRDNRESQGGVHASIVIKRPGARVVNA